MLLALCACPLSFRPVEGNPLMPTMSVEDEIEIGADVHRQIREQARLVLDPILLDYLNALGQELVATTEPQPFVYRFTIVQDDRLNAFAVPGGYIYLHSAVLAQSGSASELAGVLAHEVAHVRLRHLARAREKEGLKTLATLAAIALSGGDPAVTAIATGINVSLQIKYTRENEAEADRAGLGYMVRADYDPEGMVRFFERIAASERGEREGIPPYLFSHPAVAERIEDGRAEIRRLAPLPGLRSDDARLAAMQARLVALLEPVAGGSGLHARASFDRRLADPWLEQAQAATAAGDLEQADALLEQAQAAGPNDPRVSLARADLAEKRGDLREAELHLRRAFEIDPTVPLVQYRLGLIHVRLGQRSRGVFYLEQAAANFAPRSSARERAELEIERLSFPLLESSGVGARAGDPERGEFGAHEGLVWWGLVSRRFMERRVSLQVEWIDPQGAVAFEERLPIFGARTAASRLGAALLTEGEWTVRVRAGDSPLEERRFRVIP